MSWWRPAFNKVNNWVLCILADLYEIIIWLIFFPHQTLCTVGGTWRFITLFTYQNETLFLLFFFYFWKKKISWILLSCMNFQNTERIFHSVKENISSSYTTEKKSEECIHEYQISQRIRKYKFYLNFFTNFLHCLFCIFSMYPLWMYFFVKSNHS